MKKIDGRKAEIINVGRIFSTYRDFAVKHGYPDAAAESDLYDKRSKPKNGDIVTLLTSGEHSNKGYGYPLWIVEMANGERQIIGDVGLRILETEGGEDMTNITDVIVLKDEAIGGVEREYREVKRKANVGELVIYKNEGRIATCFDRIVNCSSETWTSTANSSKDMRVLEPTDIVRVDGKNGQSERFRLVARKADKAEKVVITAPKPRDFRFKLGDVYEVIEQSNLAKGVYVIHPEGTNAIHGGAYLRDDQYSVLEPLKTDSAATDEQSAEDDTALLVLQRQIDNLTDAVAKLTLQLKVAREDIVLIEDGVAADIDRLERAVGVGQYSEKAASGSVNPSVPKSMPPQMQRDAIVARAKADVAKLEITEIDSNYDGRSTSLTFWPYINGAEPYFPMHRVEYVINREKRTVVALIKLDSGKIDYRGIAKAAPGDCFNEFIGKAIALRRALGLPVPSDYLNAPQPEGVRVGDYVYDASCTRRMLVKREKDVLLGTNELGIEYVIMRGRYPIDDSARYDDKEVAACPNR